MDFVTFLGILTWVLVFPITAAIVAGRKNRNGAVWFFVCLVLSPLALLPLLALESLEPRPPTNMCPKCGVVNEPGRETCELCQTQLPDAIASLGAAAPPIEKVCPRCAETIKAAAKVCRFCQHEFGTA
jgi:hypothetical protein